MTVQYKPIRDVKLVHAITSFYKSGESANVEYKIGTLADDTFEPLVEKAFWIDDASDIFNKPLTSDDLGKTYDEVILARLEDHLRTKGEIKL